MVNNTSGLVYNYIYQILPPEKHIQAWKDINTHHFFKFKSTYVKGIAHPKIKIM